MNSAEGTVVNKAISVRAPWWWFILHAGKDIENRGWPTSFRGTVYLHASKWFGLQDVGADSETAVCIAREQGIAKAGSGYTFRELKGMGGCIVGKVDIIDCISESENPWFFGKFGFVLANPVAFREPIPCKGALGFFNVPDEVLAKLEAKSE